MNDNVLMDEILQQLSDNQKGLDSVLNTLNDFIETYACIREELNRLNLLKECNLENDLIEINESLGELKAISKTTTELSDIKNRLVYANKIIEDNKFIADDINERLEKIYNQTSTIELTITQFVLMVKSVQTIGKKLDLLNIDAQANQLRQYGDKLCKIAGNIENLLPVVQTNTDTINDLEYKLKNVNQHFLKVESKIPEIKSAINSLELMAKKVENLHKGIELLDIEKQEARLVQYGERIKQLESTINNKVLPLIESNNDSIDKFEKKLNVLLDERKETQEGIKVTLNEFISIRKTLESIHRVGNIDKAVLFSLFDEWQEGRKKTGKKKRW